METVPYLNPSARRLGTVNAVMGSAGTSRHHVDDFEGPLSIKFMVQGSGVWRSDAGVHHVEEGYFLVLNQGQTYSLDIDEQGPRESFCPFFRRGFVEDIRRASATGDDALLDDPEPGASRLTFHQHLHTSEGRMVPALLALRRLVYDDDAEPSDVEDAFVRLGEALLRHAGSEVPAQMARVPAGRAATRAECYRRLARARDYLHANAHRPLDLNEIATEACLSPYHFHRQFKAVHGLTPHQYLTRLRLDRACRMLRHTDQPITQIALAAGFQNPAAFSRRFTGAFGEPPVRYRQHEVRKNGKAQSRES